ncbi:MAG TPA: VOC family protein [Solirubrobacterales bacterium]|jgi:catechol 2,3-dioxygenase-like lactoylglutathione lyase family enzyme|nr:VOC family protein [Solirubrobacterales bacterium]
MLHHVGIEVAPADLERSVEFWFALGFTQVKPPAALSEFVWLERDETQIHLMPTDSPAVPPRGHTAVVVPDFENALEALSEGDFKVERRREHWGAPRAVAIAPGGHRVELMAAPPGAGKPVVEELCGP